MSLVITFTPAEEVRIANAARQKGLAPEEFARKLVTDHLPPAAASKGVDEENAAAIALLQSWIASEATDNPAEIQQAEEELAEPRRLERF